MQKIKNCTKISINLKKEKLKKNKFKKRNEISYFCILLLHISGKFT